MANPRIGRTPTKPLHGAAKVRWKKVVEEPSKEEGKKPVVIEVESLDEEDKLPPVGQTGHVAKQTVAGLVGG